MLYQDLYNDDPKRSPPILNYLLVYQRLVKANFANVFHISPNYNPILTATD